MMCKGARFRVDRSPVVWEGETRGWLTVVVRPYEAKTAEHLRAQLMWAATSHHVIGALLKNVPLPLLSSCCHSAAGIRPFIQELQMFSQWVWMFVRTRTSEGSTSIAAKR